MQANYDGIGIQIYFEQDDLDNITNKLGELSSKRNTVIARAVNRSIAPVRKIVRTETSNYYEVSPMQVEKGDDGKKAFNHDRATASRPYAVLTYKSPYINIYKWKGKRITVSPRTPHQGSSPRPKFYKSHALKGHANEPLDKGKYKPFVQYGNTKEANALFVRKGRARYPIMGLAGPALSQGIKQPGVKEKIETQAMTTLAKRIKHEIDAILKGYAT